MTAFVLVLTVVALVFAALAWLTRDGSVLQTVLAACMLSAVVAAALMLLFGVTVSSSAVTQAWRWLLSGAVAVVGGGPLTTAVLGLVDRGNPRRESTQEAAEVLRGGAAIGALERAAVYVALVVGWPEGLAVVLAIKGLARYPELRAESNGPVSRQAVAERFIIGTFTSVLWAVACAALT